jgi:hypothetical protein
MLAGSGLVKQLTMWQVYQETQETRNLLGLSRLNLQFKRVAIETGLSYFGFS